MMLYNPAVAKQRETTAAVHDRNSINKWLDIGLGGLIGLGIVVKNDHF